MENNCVTLETAKKLKAAGFPQDNPKEWVKSLRMRSYVLEYKFPIDSNFERIAAPTAQEIADQLPHSVKGKGNLEIWSWDGPTGRNWSAAYVDRNKESSMFSPAPTICEALAALWLKLKGAENE